MRAVVVAQPGGPEAMSLERIAVPRPADHQLLVRVRAAALNHADLKQREGEWPAPPGECQRLGVEVAGDVVVEDAAGQAVCGTAVCGLVHGGGYGDYCVMDATMAIPVPAGLSYAQAAALPEACLTGDTCLFALGRLAVGQAVLIHGGASGVGSMCIQMAKSVGARVACTVGSEDKAMRARALGADLPIVHRHRDFVADTRAWTDGLGVDVVIDVVGAAYFARNLAVLRDGGRLVQIGIMSGTKCEIDLDEVILRRLQILGTIMRPPFGC